MCRQRWPWECSGACEPAAGDRAAHRPGGAARPHRPGCAQPQGQNRTLAPPGRVASLPARHCAPALGACGGPTAPDARAGSCATPRAAARSAQLRPGGASGKQRPRRPRAAPQPPGSTRECAGPGQAAPGARNRTAPGRGGQGRGQVLPATPWSQGSPSLQLGRPPVNTWCSFSLTPFDPPSSRACSQPPTRLAHAAPSVKGHRQLTGGEPEGAGTRGSQAPGAAVGTPGIAFHLLTTSLYLFFMV